MIPTDTDLLLATYEKVPTEGGSHLTFDITVIKSLKTGEISIGSCGDTCIFAQDALKADVDFTQEDIESNASGKITDNTAIAGVLNKYKNMFGKARVVVIKSQLGQPIVAYSGEDVYWEIPDDLPKFTKLMIDGKALYIHRANFQIIDKSLLESN